MLWMYTQRRTRQGSLDLVYELSDYLLELELPETPELAEQAHRLFACRLHMGERVVPVTEASMTQWVEEDDPFGEVTPLHAAQAELSEELHDAMRGWGGQVCLHTLRSVQHSPFELDVYLWEMCHHTLELEGAPPALFRVARYHALAERPSARPSPTELRAFEHAFCVARTHVAHLQKELKPLRGALAL